jgi:hypothetical protein
VHTLDLSFNRIGAAGAMALAEAFPATYIRALYLSSNQIGDAMQQLFLKIYPHIKWEF